MKTIIGIVIGAVAIVGGIFTIFSMEKIDAGKVGVVYSMNGGVQDTTLSQGFHFINPFWSVKEFTIGNEQLVLSKDEREGSPGDDSFNVATSDDANISISFQMSYRYQADKVVDTYKKFKGMDGEQIVEHRIKTIIKSKISEVTTNYSLMDIYSGNRSEINQKITDYLNESFIDEYGIEVLDASIIEVHPDEKLKQAIDSRVETTQKKQQALLEQEKIQVEAETALIKAENEAKIKLQQAQAEAEANKMIANSITPELIQMKEAEARMEHGWVEVQGADSVVKTN